MRILILNLEWRFLLRLIIFDNAYHLEKSLQFIFKRQDSRYEYRLNI